ncbi:MAG: rod shape-determining protein MreC [Candidatus Liptonbacteria bacterium]|nr:rod shape-determining protein MreC [Candidatus Liptonbacteria bacterium]
MTAEKVTILALTLIFLGLIFVGPAVLRSFGNVLTFGPADTVARISAEELEQKVRDMRVGVNSGAGAKFVLGDVYSGYPLNLKDELLVNVGARDGVKPFGAVTWNGILVGKIKEVKEEFSVIQTIFDPKFSLPVRAGESGADALLKGGVEPKLTLIPKNVETKAGDVVYSASADFEYGMPLGVGGPLITSANSVFSEADLLISYGPSELRYLFLEKNRNPSQ